jgi:hypothetical protein
MGSSEEPWREADCLGTLPLLQLQDFFEHIADRKAGVDLVARNAPKSRGSNRRTFSLI